MIDRTRGGPVRRHPYGILLLLWALLAATAATAATEATPGRRVLTLDRIVAVVNDEVITELELDERATTS